MRLVSPIIPFLRFSILFLLLLFYVDPTFGSTYIKNDTLPQGNEWQLALQWSKNGENEKAAIFYETAYTKDPNPILYRQYLDVLLQLKRYKEAEDLINRQKKSEKKSEKESWKENSKALFFIDLANVYKQSGNNSKADKSFLQAIDDYISHSGTGVSIDELSNALWQKSGSAKYSLDLYLRMRKITGNTTMFSYEISKCYMALDKIENMVNESLLFVESQAQGIISIQADWQGLIYSSSDGSNTIARIKKALNSIWQKEPQNKNASELLWWVNLQEKNYEEAFNIGIAYKIHLSDGGAKILETAQIAIENQAYEVAEKALENLIKDESDVHPQIAQKALISLLNLHFMALEQQRIDASGVERLKGEYERLYEAHKQEPDYYPVARNLARIYAYYTAQEEKAIELMEDIISNQRIGNLKRAEIKVEYADMLLFIGRNWDALLLYAQVEKDFKQDAIGFYAKLQSAKLSYYIGEFEWAKSQLDVLKAATAKLIANDAMELSLMIKENNNQDSTYYGLSYVAKADAFVYRRLYTKALPLLDSVLEMPYESQLYDDVYYKKAQIYIKIDSVELALYALERVYKQEDGYPASIWADDALLLAAKTYEKQGQREKAMDLALQLFTRFPSSLLVPQARELYRKLRQ